MSKNPNELKKTTIIKRWEVKYGIEIYTGKKGDEVFFLFPLCRGEESATLV